MTTQIITTIIVIFLVVLIEYRNYFIGRGRRYFAIKNIDYSSISEDYTILIPLWGKKELIDHLYWIQGIKKNVLICTTANESQEFYNSLETKGYKYMMLKIEGKVNPFKLLQEGMGFVETKNVIFIDADTIPKESPAVIAGNFENSGQDLCSLIVVPSQNNNNISMLQYIEYRSAMLARNIYPWLTSGAAMVAKTTAMRDVLYNHSLFFNGGDIEIGKLFSILKYKVGHLPFYFFTDVPMTVKAWIQQRIKWMAGAFRHNIINFHTHNWKYPIYFLYFTVLVIVCFPFKIYEAITTPWILPFIILVYSLVSLIFIFPLDILKKKPYMPVLYSMYCLFQILVILPLGAIYYFKNAIKYKNAGIITIRNSISESRLTKKDWTVNFFGTVAASISLIVIIILLIRF